MMHGTINIISSQISACFRDCECLHQLLTGYKQGYADSCNWEDGIMRWVTPHVRFECNFNLEDSKSSASFHQYSWTQFQLYLLGMSLNASNYCVCVNNIQQDATVCRHLFTAKPLYMFRCIWHPSSGVHQTVTAASGTGHSVRATTFLQRGLQVTLEEGCCSDTMTCTRGCCYSLMYSWWWVRRTPETCRVILQ